MHFSICGVVLHLFGGGLGFGVAGSILFEVLQKFGTVNRVLNGKLHHGSLVIDWDVLSAVVLVKLVSVPFLGFAKTLGLLAHRDVAHAVQTIFEE